MKIISWNCNSTFREKISTIFDENSENYLDADIYVICECENPEDPLPKYKEYKRIVEDFAGDNYFWVGDIHWKGLGIFAKKDIKLEPIEGLNERFKNFIALRVNDSFNLLGVWAMNKDSEKGLNAYTEMIHDYFDANTQLFDEDLVMCGDFNSNVVWDYTHKAKDSEGNAKDQTNLNIKLNNKGLFSVYHESTGEKQGKETKPTFYQSWNLNKPYHIDYVYAAKGVVTTLEIGDADKWLELSDHMPLTFEF